MRPLVLSGSVTTTPAMRSTPTVARIAATVDRATTTKLMSLDRRFSWLPCFCRAAIVAPAVGVDPRRTRRLSFASPFSLSPTGVSPVRTVSDGTYDRAVHAPGGARRDDHHVSSVSPSPANPEASRQVAGGRSVGGSAVF